MAQGTQVQFGRNRVQYKNFSWQYYKGDRVNTYFYLGGQELGVFTIKEASAVLEEVEEILQHKYTTKVDILVFTDPSDIYQTNIGYNMGMPSMEYMSTTEVKIEKGKVFLYFNGDHGALLQQLKKSLLQLLLNDMLYGGSVVEMAQNSVLLYFPDWYTSGLVDYYANGFTADDADAFRALLAAKKSRKFLRYTRIDPVLSGKALWHYIEMKYSQKIVSNILYMSKLNRNIEYGFVYLLGKSSTQIFEDCLAYYDKAYEQLPKDNTEPEWINKKKLKRDFKYYNLAINDEGNKIAYVRNRLGRYHLRVYDTQTHKRKTLMRAGIRSTGRVLDKQNLLFQWIPNSNELTLIYEKKDEIFLKRINLDTKEKVQDPLKKFQKVHDFSFDPNGQNIYLSASHKGQSDIFRMHIETQRLTPLTNDIYDDLNPIYIRTKERNGIYFLSNRPIDKSDKTINWNQKQICYWDFNNKQKRISNLGQDQFNNFRKLIKADDHILALNDYNSLTQAYSGEIDTLFVQNDSIFYFTDSMSINPKNGQLYIDNPDKYGLEEMELVPVKRPIIQLQPVTHSNKGIVEHASNSNGTKVLQLTRAKKRMQLSFEPFRYVNDFKSTQELFQSEVKEKKQPTERNKEPSKPKPTHYFVPPYDFPKMEKTPEKKAPQLPAFIKRKREKKGFSKSQVLVYEPTMHIEYANYKLDNGTTLTPYTLNGSGNGLNPMYRASITDLFEDYRIQGGFKAPLDFSDKEYFVFLANNKKRLDKRFVYSRGSYIEIDQQRTSTTIGLENFATNKRISQIGELQLRYPFSASNAIAFATTLKKDTKYARAIEMVSLEQTYKDTLWSYGRLEYIYDNSIEIGHNSRSGTRFKAFYEYQRLLNDRNTYTQILGMDFRSHLRVHKQITFNNRLAAGQSFGPMNVAYLLGGPDGWIGAVRDTGIGRAPGYNFIQETNVTNQRGFLQNSRNGNKYAVLNSELRIPIIRYLSLPWYKEFWQKLQFIGFADLGTAWVGNSPTDDENPYKSITQENGPVKVTSYYDVDAILKTFGWGVRTQVMGYYLKLDYSWPFHNGVFHEPRIQLSTILDF